MQLSRFSHAIVGLTLAVSGCAPAPQGTSPQDASVYAVAFDSLFAISYAKSPDRLVVLQPSTDTEPSAEWPSSYLQVLHDVTDADSALVSNFATAVRSAATLRPIMDSLRVRLGKPVVLITTADIRQIQHRTDSLVRLLPPIPSPRVDMHWQSFYTQFPGALGWLSVSRIGYNPVHDRALLTVSWGCGGLCGESNLVVLERRVGRWRVTRVKQLSVS